jgi:hypothetical protein
VKKTGSSQAFTPQKRVKFEGEDDEELEDSFVTMNVPAAVKFFLKPVFSKSEDEPFTLSEDAWNTVCTYLAILDKKFPELQEVIAKAKVAMTERVMGVADEIGTVVVCGVDLGHPLRITRVVNLAYSLRKKLRLHMAA